jgi:hypothetical protein
MPFSITNLISDPSGVVVALDWTYTNSDGTLSNQLKLAAPDAESTLPFSEVTQAKTLEWLEAQLGNTADEFDAAITATKARQDYANALVAYASNDAGSFTAVPTPE